MGLHSTDIPNHKIRNQKQKTKISENLLRDILVISGKEDHIVKSDRAITELLALSNQQLRVINVINGSHLTPLTRAKEYLSLIQNHETEKYAEIIL